MGVWPQMWQLRVMKTVKVRVNREADLEKVKGEQIPKSKV